MWDNEQQENAELKALIQFVGKYEFLEAILGLEEQFASMTKLYHNVQLISITEHDFLLSQYQTEWDKMKYFLIQPVIDLCNSWPHRM